MAASERKLGALRRQLRAGVRRLAELKALHLRANRELRRRQARVAELAQDARQALQDGQDGTLETGEADRLARAALLERERLTATLPRQERDAEQASATVKILEAQMQTLDERVATWETQLATLKARGEFATAALQVNEQLAAGDAKSVTRLLDDMDAGVEQAEALAAAYREIAEEDRKHAAEQAFGLPAAEDDGGSQRKPTRRRRKQEGA